MARIAIVALVLCATIALALGSSSDVDLSHDFLEVDPMRNEYAQLAEQGVAFTELGAEVEDVALTETEADAETEAETESEEAGAPAPAKPAAPAAPKPVVAGVKPFAPPAPIKAPIGVIIPPEKKCQAGWTLKERAAPESVNSTDLYALAYDRYKTCKWVPANVSVKFPIKEFTYVLVGGPQARKDYFGPVRKALENYGVPKENCITASVQWNLGVNKSAEVLFKAINHTFFNVLKEQRIVIIAHSVGVIPVHAMLTANNTAASLIHGVIAINPVWGGSYIADNYKGLPADVSKVVQAQGIPAGVLAQATYGARKQAVRAFPLDYNSFRAMVIATHIEKSKDFAATVSYLKKYSKEINDGVVALSDQVIPGGRAVILNNLDHDDLVYPTDKTAATDSVVAAQSYIYSFFKATP